jgi:hypothetical protein
MKKTSHQFARELLAMPDLQIVIPDVKKYDENGWHHMPVATKLTGEECDGNPAVEVIQIS